MYIDKFKRFAPDVDTEWGTFDNPNVDMVIADREARGFPVPSQIHGRHEFAMQPRPLGPGVQYMNGLAGSPYSMVQDYVAADDSKFAVVLIVAALVGVLAYLWGHSSGVRQNPRRNPRRASCSNPPCEEGCRKVKRATRRRVPSKRRHQLACAMPRDAETGRFVSEADIVAGRYK